KIKIKKNIYTHIHIYILETLRNHLFEFVPIMAYYYRKYRQLMNYLDRIRSNLNRDCYLYYSLILELWIQVLNCDSFLVHIRVEDVECNPPIYEGSRPY